MRTLLFLSFLPLLFLLASCVTDAKKKDNPAASTKADRSNLSEVAARLYQNYHDQPTTQAQKDENRLIDYAVDKNLDVTKTASGLYYVITQKGTGPLLLDRQPCKANYQGSLLSGKVFDSSYTRGKPITFSVGQMIAGWNEALLLMNAGTKATLLIPSHLAYGQRGFSNLIGPHEPLVFDLEILPL